MTESEIRAGIVGRLRETGKMLPDAVIDFIVKEAVTAGQAGLAFVGKQALQAEAHGDKSYSPLSELALLNEVTAGKAKP